MVCLCGGQQTRPRGSIEEGNIFRDVAVLIYACVVIPLRDRLPEKHNQKSKRKHVQ